jgi:hypothetical protein
MSKSSPKKRNKKYRGPSDTYDPTKLAYNAARKLTDAQQQMLIGPALEGYHKLREGKAQRVDWNRVIDALNAGEALAQIGIGSNLEAEFLPGFQAMHDIALRMLAGKGSTCRASELEAIRAGLNNYAVQIKLCSQSEYNKAVARVRGMLTSGKYMTVKAEYEASLRPKEAA